MPEMRRRPQANRLTGGVGAVYRRASPPCQTRFRASIRFSETALFRDFSRALRLSLRRFRLTYMDRARMRSRAVFTRVHARAVSRACGLQGAFGGASAGLPPDRSRVPGSWLPSRTGGQGVPRTALDCAMID